MTPSSQKPKRVSIEKLLGDPGTLKRKSTTAVLWLWSGGLLRGGIGLVVTSILARNLGATPYGLYAIINAVIIFSIYLADSGIAVALIQRESVDDLHIRSCHTYAVLQGFAVGLLTAIAAIPVGHILNEPLVILPLAVSAVSIPMAAWGTTSLALLRRELRHRDAQWCQFGGYILSQLCVALPLAIKGYGVWALVAGLLTQWATQPLLLWLITKHDIRPCFQRDKLSKRFTWSIMIQNLSIWTLTSIDQLILSHAGLPAQVGLYNRAKWSTEAPNMYVVPAIQSVVLATASRSQTDRRRIKSLLIKSLLMASVSGIVVLAIAVAFPSIVVHVLLGKKFAGAVGLLPILALERLFWCLFTPIGQTLNGLGHPELEARSMVILIPIAIISYSMASHYGGAHALAWGTAGMSGTRLITQAALMLHIYKKMPSNTS